VARVLVIGGSGVISAHCTTELLAAGHDVTSLRRGTFRPTPVPAGLVTIVGDRNDQDALTGALRSVGPEVVIDFACFTEDQAEGLARALPQVCRQVVLVSTVDVYGLPLRQLPMPEAAPWSPPGSAYAAAKLQAEAQLRDALRSGTAALTVVRPTYSYGGGFLISLFNRSGAELVARLRSGATVLLPDGGRRLIHPSDARDTGRMIALATGAGVALGRDYTVGTPGATMTQRAYVEMIARALGVRPCFHEVASVDLDPDGVLDPASLWPELTCHDLSYDLSRFLADFPGFRPATDAMGAIRAYAAHLDPADDDRRADGQEARALAALAAGQVS
jgi:nucleoside-diphosphate-sugar epimerase